MKHFLKKYLGFIIKKQDPNLESASNTLGSSLVNIDIQGERSNSITSERKEIRNFQSAVDEEEGFESFARYLSLRIFSKSHFDSFSPDEFIIRYDLDDTITVLVLDYPSSIEHVLRLNTIPWGKTDDELFERALKNIQETYHRVVIPYEGYPQAGMFALTGEDSFKTSAVLYMEEYPALQGIHGALVAIPDKDSLLCKILEDDISLEIGMQFLVHYTDETYHQSESPVSRQIYWYMNGEFTVIPYSIGIERMTYVLPFDLEDRLY
jgi:hypothetical protein